MMFGRSGCERSAYVDRDGDVCIGSEVGSGCGLQGIAWVFKQDWPAFRSWLTYPHGPFTPVERVGAHARFQEDGGIRFWGEANTLDGETIVTYNMALSPEETRQFIIWFQVKVCR